MRKLSIISLIALLAIVVTSCGSSNNVVNNGIISKRKYTKGFFLNRKSNLKTAQNNTKEADLKEEKAIAKAERVEARKERKLRKVVAEEQAVASVEKNEVMESIESTNAPSEASVQSETSSSSFSEDGLAWDVVEEQPIETKESEEVVFESNKDAVHKKSQKNQNSNSDAMFILAVIFAFFIPPLGVAIYTNIDWVKVLIAFLLTLLGWLPGVIYAFLVVFDVI